MFTGLVEETGRIERIEESGDRRFWIAAARVLEDARVGDSLALNGCCLTAVAVEPGRFAVEAVRETAFIPHTLRVTVAGEYRPGRRVNLEVDLIARYLARLLDEADLQRRGA